MKKIISFIKNQFGSRALLMNFIAGSLAVLALPPLYIFPALFISLSAFYFLLQAAKTGHQAFWRGWFFGFGFFVFGLYWIGNAVLVDSAQFGWLWPFAVMGIPAGLSFFIGLQGYLFYRTQTLSSIRRYVLFAVLWTIVEFLRGSLFTGFPWNLIASTLAFHPLLLQPLSIIGSYGLGFFVVLLATLPVLFYQSDKKSLKTYSISALSLIAVVLVFSAYRLYTAPHGYQDNQVYRIVQPNIPQTNKWHQDLRIQHLNTLASGSRQPSVDPLDVIIWPETAVPFFIDQSPNIRIALSKLLRNDAILITGAPRTNEQQQLFNGLIVLNAKGQVAGSYNKSHLVPFGEYVPLQTILPFKKLVPGWTDFTSGTGPQTLKVGHIPPFSPLICYEIIFPGSVVDDNKFPQWLLNITNDGWYGNSSGPYQHFTTSRMRAVEEGIPMVRVANTGISGVVDSYGRIIGKLPLNQQGLIDFKLPLAATNRTCYSLFENNLMLLFLLLISIACVFYNRNS